ncbi:MAG: hypothetical protein KAU02_02895 [Tenericutes bacterium]|nr:hypothetical protein [Mycoplasmatota bacterium]
MLIGIVTHENMKPRPLLMLVLSFIMLVLTVYFNTFIMFLVLNVSLLTFCVVNLTIKLNHFFIATVFIVLSGITKDLYFFFTGGINLDIIWNGLLVIGVLMNLLVFGNGIYRIFKKKEYVSNLLYLLFNIMVYISVTFISKTYIINFNSITRGSFERTSLHFFYTFLTYLIFIAMILLFRKLTHKKKDIKDTYIETI